MINQQNLNDQQLQDYINSQNMSIMDPSLRQQYPTQGVQVAGPMVPGSLPQTQPAQPTPGVNPTQTQPVNPTQSSVQATQPAQPPVQTQQTQQTQPQPGSAEYMNQEAGNEGAVIGYHPTSAQAYTDIQQDPQALLNFAKNPDTEPHMQEQATKRAGDLLATERDKNEAIQKIGSMNQSELAQSLKEKTSGGSWTKAIVFGMLGMHNLAQEEAAKLGIGKETPMLGPDGPSYLVKVAANGTPLEGFNAHTGKKLTPEELVQASAFGTGMQGAQTAQTLGYDEKGNVISHTTLKNGNVIRSEEHTSELQSH